MPEKAAKNGIGAISKRKYNKFMITDENIELIEKFLKEKLHGKELLQFEQKVLQDKEFAQDVQFFKDMNAGLKKTGRQALKKKLQNIASDIERVEIMRSHTSTFFFTANKKYIAIAASVSLLIISSVIFYYHNKNSQEIIADETITTDTLNQDRIIKEYKFDIEKYLADNNITFEIKTLEVIKIEQETFGYAELNTTPNKLEVVFISEDKYNKHYLLRDKLYLFGDYNEADIKLHLYEQQTGHVIFLEIENVVYRLEKTTFDVLFPLVEETDNLLIKQLIKSSVENKEKKSAGIVLPPQTSKSRQIGTERRSRYTGSNETVMTGLSKTNNKNAPNSCKIIGTIVNINQKLNLPDTSSVCAKAPCEAIVKIETIKRRGASFTGDIATGEKIKVHFAFTLNPTTKELFPNMTARYPGLKRNDKFIADIQSRLSIGKKENIKYVIYGYEKIE